MTGDNASWAIQTLLWGNNDLQSLECNHASYLINKSSRQFNWSISSFLVTQRECSTLCSSRFLKWREEMSLLKTQWYRMFSTVFSDFKICVRKVKAITLNERESKKWETKTTHRWEIKIMTFSRLSLIMSRGSVTVWWRWRRSTVDSNCKPFLTRIWQEVERRRRWHEICYCFSDESFCRRNASQKETTFWS